MPPFDRVQFVLVAPSRWGNIGASARALRTMGIARLVVVAPQDPQFKSHPEALAFATHGADVLAQAAVVATLGQALHGSTLNFAMTGYAREFGPPLLDLQEAARRAAAHLQAQPDRVSFVFGAERSGLLNADVERCHFTCAIAADPQAASLNLAQAVQIAAYECRRALAGEPAAPAARFAEDPAASGAQLEGLYRHLEQALIALGFLDPQVPGRLMSRLRRLFARAQPTVVELDILRGIAAVIIERKAERAGRKQRGR